MATKIKLMRLGKMRAPYYRIVVADARTKRDGRVIETIGKYHPKQEPSLIEVDGERAAYWLGVGAQATEPVERLLKVTGDWQRFKGEAPPPPMRLAEPRANKRVAFEAAAQQGLDGRDGAGPATTPRKSTRNDAQQPPDVPATATPTATPAATATPTATSTVTPAATASPAGAPATAAPAAADAPAAP